MANARRSASIQPTNSCRRNLLDVGELIGEHLEAPEAVLAFEQVEELGRQFSIEPPFAARTSLSAFDVYDARRLIAGGADEDRDEENDFDRANASQANGAAVGCKRQAGLATWFRRLNSAGAGSARLKLACCVLNKSDTLQEFGQVSPAASSVQLDSLDLHYGIDHAHEPPPPDPEVLADLRADVQELLGPLIGQARGSSCLVATREPSRAGSSNDLQQPGLESLGQQQQVILDAPLNHGTNVSVCLLDKRKRRLAPDDSVRAINGCRWALLVASLAELQQRLGAWRQFKSKKHQARLERKIECFLRRRQISALGIGSGARATGDCTTSRSARGIRPAKVSKEQMEQLIESTKDSLNHLIDVQLLLRNKLAESGQQQSWLRDVDSELLLKNNFNLLKIWQNLEETKQIACFVCEPIKANLADLFWFNQQRPTKALELALRGSRSSLANSSPLFFVSPLACLDSFQVKRGLLQVSIGNFRYHTGRVYVESPLEQAESIAEVAVQRNYKWWLI